MADLDLPNEISAYREQFHNAELGSKAVARITAKHELHGDARRCFDSSNLVFAFDNCWLKLYPPFRQESYQTEMRVLKAWAGHLSVASPRLIVADQLGGWNYAITTHVEGHSFAELNRSLSGADRNRLAEDTGMLIKSIKKVGPLSLACEGRKWEEYVDMQISNAKEIYLSRGCTIDWAERIAVFQKETKDLVGQLRKITTVHADLNHAHLLLDKSTHRLCGAIDFADAMDAPAEVEFILPFLDCFRGDFHRQKLLIESSGQQLGFSNLDYSRGFMALTLLNRFICFEQWFDLEIERLKTTSIDEIARAVFPSTSV